MASRLGDARTWTGESHDGSATRQLHFSYWPVLTKEAPTRVAKGLMQHWLQERSASMAFARPVPGFRVAAGVLTQADRFVITHAATALEHMQADGIAGCAVIHVTLAGLSDPLLPAYVVSKLRQRGVSLVGVTVALAPHPPGAAEIEADRSTPAAGLSSRGLRLAEGHVAWFPPPVPSLGRLGGVP